MVANHGIGAGVALLSRWSTQGRVAFGLQVDVKFDLTLRPSLDPVDIALYPRGGDGDDLVLEASQEGLQVEVEVAVLVLESVQELGDAEVELCVSVEEDVDDELGEKLFRDAGLEGESGEVGRFAFRGVLRQ